jgi:uncharacterized protein YcfJ
MKPVFVVTTLAVLLTAATADVSARPGHHHGWKHGHADGYGRVMRVKPIYDTVEVSVPEEYCGDGYLGAAPDPALAGAVAGGVVGALAGDQFGSGKTVVTVAGTVIGATVGHEVGPGLAEWYPASQWIPGGCETVERTELREELVGYRVKYRYRGHVYHTRTDYHPGDRIRVNRRARPIHF